MRTAPPRLPTAAPATPRVRPLPLRRALRPVQPSDIWFKPATSVLIAQLVPNLILLALGRLDLAAFTMAGSLCALFAHNLPYIARARALAWVVAGMTAGVASALGAAALTSSVPVLIAVAAALAAAQKAVCDATAIGPPGPLIMTFITSATLFLPGSGSAAQIPGHLALVLATGAFAWLVGMAPILLYPQGPERRATGRALRAAAAYADTRGAGPGHERLRSAATGAVHAAWQSLLAAGADRPERRDRQLELLVVRAEVALAAPAAADADLLRVWAAALPGRRPLSRPAGLPSADPTFIENELAGIEAERAAPRPHWWHRLAPGSAAHPLVLRTFLGCALAGYASYAAGVGRPYWAVIAAASLFQANVTLTWNRALQRSLGTLGGVLVLAAVTPLTRVGALPLVLCTAAFGFGAEALITRNYWIGNLCVTPMALLITQFAHRQPAGQLISDRIVDTVLGAAVGFATAVAVTNRRAGRHLERALDAAETARVRCERALADDGTDPAARERARRTLVTALVDLRVTADTTAGEWWQPALPEERLLDAERSGHMTLAVAVRQRAAASARRAADATGGRYSATKEACG
ncbi:FUSC family protein [Actinacidiphila paucisporea]|uniref:Fusaric acid resistance protein-like n=1 Tax=Actinacidiphila paucisporea TaxID=310782 RepID=A0A1M7M0B8_9ACTN|nr:FUSC family protein [Actinacidiphila paucisporea]SHM84115.1 Fusaric acid resistance protein-like [Actinacidiphila paucisporea]